MAFSLDNKAECLMPEKGASIRTHSLVSSQEMAVCHQGNRPKTGVLFCRYVGVFRSLILA